MKFRSKALYGSTNCGALISPTRAGLAIYHELVSDSPHTCQVLRFRRSHYGFLEKLKTTAVVGKDYGFTLGWGCNFLVTI